MRYRTGRLSANSTCGQVRAYLAGVPNCHQLRSKAISPATVGSMTSYTYWLKGQNLQNFGDYLTDYFLTELFTSEEIINSNVTVHLVGSVLSDWQVQADKIDHPENIAQIFWGVGARDGSSLSQLVSDPSNVILSVRGPETASLVGDASGLVLGDPALLLPLIYAPKAGGVRIRKLVVPHFLDTRSDSQLLATTGADTVLRPNISASREEVERFISTICSAERVLCGALHAAIVAEAYGVDYCYWDSGEIDVPFKWQDFSLSVGRETVFTTSFSKWPEAPKDQCAKPISLLAIALSAPKIVKPEILRNALTFDLAKLGAAGLVSELSKSVHRSLRRFNASLLVVAERDGLVAERDDIQNSKLWRWSKFLRHREAS